MKKVFERERLEEILRSEEHAAKKYFSDENIAHLPGPIRKYLVVTGYMNRPLMYNADVIWKESYLKLQPDKKWLQLKTRQFNSINPLVRIAYMKFLAMPVSGRDLYRNGQGEMKGKLLNFFTVINGKGNEVSQSSLITLFCEFLFIPGYILGEYVTWEYVDEKTVKATLIDDEYEVTGLFYFDEQGLFTRFESNDRFYSVGKGKTEKTRFSVK